MNSPDTLRAALIAFLADRFFREPGQCGGHADALLEAFDVRMKGEAMRVELRPDTEATNRPNTLPILDEAVIDGACSVHVEMLDDAGLHIAIQGEDDHWISLYVSIAKVGGKHVLELRGEE